MEANYFTWQRAHIHESWRDGDTRRFFYRFTVIKQITLKLASAVTILLRQNLKSNKIKTYLLDWWTQKFDNKNAKSNDLHVQIEIYCKKIEYSNRRNTRRWPTQTSRIWNYRQAAEYTHTHTQGWCGFISIDCTKKTANEKNWTSQISNETEYVLTNVITRKLKIPNNFH